MTITVQQINTSTDTFGTWITKFNTIANIISTNTVTADFSNTGSTTTGNVFVNGYFTSVNTYVTNTLYGGSPVSTASLNVGSTLNVNPGTISNVVNSTVSLANFTTNDTVTPETLNITAVRTITGNTPQTVSFKVQSKQSNSYVQFDPFLASSNSQINAVGLGVGNTLGLYVTSNSVVAVQPITLAVANITTLTVTTTNANVINTTNVTATLVTTNTANVINVEASSVNTNFLTANSVKTTTLNANSATITNLVTSNASVDVHSSNSITANVFLSTTTNGYQFVNSTGYFGMNAAAATVVVPVGGFLTVVDTNAAAVSVRGANATTSNSFVPLGQADTRYAPLAGNSSVTFNSAGLNVHTTNSFATIYTTANNNDINFNVGAGARVVNISNTGVFNTPGDVICDHIQVNNTTGVAFTNSTGGYYMDATNGIAYIPNGGGFYVHQVNGTPGTFECGQIITPNGLSITGVVVWPTGASVYSDSGVGDIVLHSTSSNNQYYAVFSNTGNFGVPGNITAGGNVTAGSDIKLKYKISTHENALEKIGKLRPVEFNWKKDDKHSIGFIAQEVEEIFPEFVDEFIYKTEEGEETLKGIDYGKLTAPLVKAVQELTDYVGKLEARIKELESK